jgi:hypothetical protein
MTHLRLIDPNAAAQPSAYDAETLVRSFAKLHGGRVKRFRYLVSATGKRVACFHDLRESPIETFTARATLETRRVWIECTGPNVKAGFPERGLPTGMYCSIGGAEQLGLRPSALRAGRAGEFPVYLSSRMSERVPELLASNALSVALDAVALGEGESLQTLSGLGVTLVRPSLERLTAVLDALAVLGGTFTRNPRVSLPAGFPRALVPMSPVALEWGIVDPCARPTRVAEAHPDALRRMLGTAAHYATKVDHYLETTRRPSSEVAQIIRAYREAVALATARLDGVVELRRPRRRQAGRVPVV